MDEERLVLTFIPNELQYFQKITENSLNALESRTDKDSEKVQRNKEGLSRILSKINTLLNIQLGFEISEQDLNTIDNCLANLRRLTSEYSSISDITQIDAYDRIKKQFATHYATLSEYYGKFEPYTEYLEYKVKKQWREKIIQMILEESEPKISRSQAKEMVDSDERYVKLYEEMMEYMQIFSTMKMQYYSSQDVLTSIVQSVTTARIDQQKQNIHGQ